MLVIKLIGVAVFVALVVRWKRLRLPLLLVVLVAVLYYMLCNSSAPVKPHNTMRPEPAVDIEQGTGLDGGAHDNEPIYPGCTDPKTCGDPTFLDGGPKE